MNVAYNFSREYLSGFFRGQISVDDLLAATSPIFRWLLVLCHTAASAETLIDILPPAMIRTAIQCCASNPTTDATVLQNLIFVLESLEGLTRIAFTSLSCLTMLRRSLELQGTSEDASYEGPAFLVTIPNSSIDSKITRHVLGTIANRLQGA